MTAINFTDKQIESNAFKCTIEIIVAPCLQRILAYLLRAVGQNPSQEEIEDIISSVEQRNENLDFDEFCALLEQVWKDVDQLEELRNAFLVFDREGNGYITQDELKKAMISLGETLNDEELKEMLKDCNVNTDGTINYEDFVKTVTASMQ